MSQAKTGKDDKPAKEARGQKENRPPREPKAPREARPPREGRQQQGGGREQAQREAPRESKPSRPAPVPRLQIHYRDTVVKQLMEQFGYKTTMQVPRIEKIVLNMGVGEAVADKKIMDNAVADLHQDRRARSRSSPTRASRSRCSRSARATPSAAR